MQARKKTSGLKLTFLPKDALKWSHSYLTHRPTSNKKITKKFKRHWLLSSATHFTFEPAVLWGFSDEQTSLLSITNILIALESYPANPNNHYMHAFLSAVSKMYFISVLSIYYVLYLGHLQKLQAHERQHSFVKYFCHNTKSPADFKSRNPRQVSTINPR